MEIITCAKRNLWQKILLGIVLGLLSTLDEIIKGCSSEIIIQSFMLCLFACYVIWTGSETIFAIVNKIYSWEILPLKKALILVVSNLLFVTIFLLLLVYTYFKFALDRELKIEDMYVDLMMAILVTTIINLIYIGTDFYSFWRKSVYEVDVLRQENLRSQLETLKNQVNPHFLFNSLNTLASVIDEDTQIAKEFVLKLSQVYRYILQSNEKDIVTIEDELIFIRSYNYLLQIRYGENLKFKIDISKKYFTFCIPPFVLQMLVENAIKHNVISTIKPLYVNIEIEDDFLLVRNNFQPKTVHVDSNNIGLKNISDRYKLLAHKEIEIIQNDYFFEVRLPLFEAEAIKS